MRLGIPSLQQYQQKPKRNYYYLLLSKRNASSKIDPVSDKKYCFVDFLIGYGRIFLRIPLGPAIKEGRILSKKQATGQKDTYAGDSSVR